MSQVIRPTHRNHSYFLYNNERAETKFKSIVPFTSVTENEIIEHILRNYILDVYSKSYEMLMKKFKEDLNKWGGICCSWIGRLNTMKISICPASQKLSSTYVLMWQMGKGGLTRALIPIIPTS